MTDGSKYIWLDLKIMAKDMGVLPLLIDIIIKVDIRLKLTANSI